MGASGQKRNKHQTQNQTKTPRPLQSEKTTKTPLRCEEAKQQNKIHNHESRRHRRTIDVWTWLQRDVGTWVHAHPQHTQATTLNQNSRIDVYVKNENVKRNSKIDVYVQPKKTSILYKGIKTFRKTTRCEASSAGDTQVSKHTDQNIQKYIVVAKFKNRRIRGKRKCITKFKNRRIKTKTSIHRTQTYDWCVDVWTWLHRDVGTWVHAHPQHTQATNSIKIQESTYTWKTKM